MFILLQYEVIFTGFGMNTEILGTQHLTYYCFVLFSRLLIFLHNTDPLRIKIFN